MKSAISIIALLAIVPMSSGAVCGEEPAVAAMQEYLLFAPYDAGIIMPVQLTKDIFDSIVFIDTRSAVEFEAETIPGALHIEWREVLARRDEIPGDRKVVLFCNTGSLSAQAVFALRVAGMTNVLVLQSGIAGWKKDAAFQP